MATVPLAALAGCASSDGSTSSADKIQPITIVVPPARDAAPGYVFLTAAESKSYAHGPMIVDEDGELVWFLPATTGTSNLQVQQYRGEPVLTWWYGRNVLPGYGKGEYAICDSSYRRIATVKAGNGLEGDLHEFVLTPEGTALFTCYRAQPADLSSVGGAKDGVLLNSLMQEVDVASGKVLFEWDAAKHVSFDLSYVSPPSSGSSEWDFFHINSIDLDTDGNYLISSRQTWAVYKVDRSSGEVIWRLNGKESDFAMAPNTHFYWQHHVRHHPGGLLSIFDDGAGLTREETRSRGLMLELDTSSMKASFVEQYLPDPSLLASSRGSMQLLPDGHVFIGWGSEPYFSEYTRQAELIYDARLPIGSLSYRAFKFPWIGRPTDAPHISVRRSGDRSLEVSASWNGATEVARWDALAGRTTSGLRLVGSAQRAGYSTAIGVTVTREDSYVAVEARDPRGIVLGRSRTLTL